jgi:hypothetical protein
MQLNLKIIKINNNDYLLLYFMLLRYSGGIMFKTKNEKYNASNALAEINTVRTIFVDMFWLI